MKYAYIHTECGNPAFLLAEYPKKGAHVKADMALHLDGSAPQSGADVICGSCGKTVRSPHHGLSRLDIMPIEGLMDEQKAKLKPEHRG